MKPYIVAITGASGAVYGVRLLEVLAEARIPVELVISDTAWIVMKEELGIDSSQMSFPHVLRGNLRQTASADPSSGGQFGSPIKAFGDDKKELIHLHDFHDFTAPIASGSYPVEGMVIIPCSMGTLGAIASGLSQNLIHRAADCTIKEGRKLILVPRETPLSAIHLENMLKLSRLGVRIVPAMPAFYSGPPGKQDEARPSSQGGQQSIQELIDFMVGKVLDQMGIPHMLYPRWVGSSQTPHADPLPKGEGNSFIPRPERKGNPFIPLSGGEGR